MESIGAVILTAGLGKRLRPLTELLPKPMLPIVGKPLIDIILEKLIKNGATRVHCNLFHQKEKLSRHLSSRGFPVMLHVEEELLGTGGGIGGMKSELIRYEAILIHNGDILSNFDYTDATTLHKRRKALMTMILLKEGPPANVLCRENGTIAGIHGKSPEKKGIWLGYTGMAILSNEALKYFPDSKRADLVDIINKMIETEPERVIYWRADETDTKSPLWVDIGTLKGYLKIHEMIILEKAKFHPSLPPPPLPFHICEGAEIDPGARWEGFLEVQRGARIKGDTFLKNCIVMEGTTVEKGTVAEESIIAGEKTIKVE